MSAESVSSSRVRGVIEGVAKKCGVDIYRIILFGSRARGDFKEGSDWDFLVIVTRYDRKLIKEFLLEVRRALVDLGITPEVIVAERDVVEKYKDHTGYVYYYALSEGIVL